ncbi:hypothetical protein TNCT_585121 [Trichonephila clavata]|uniref:Uncharacterized protein n=1 Tax=Trichonephila clavata TaxID=2740835 RepID=A0A8X6FVH5_TRICU|nr:hypothetical protein TNCT_585121 [Trichonephila clavata]
METFLAEGSIAVSGIVASRAPLGGGVGKRTVFFSNAATAASCLLDGPRKSGERVEEGRFSDSQNRRPEYGEETGFKKGIASKSDFRAKGSLLPLPLQEGKRGVPRSDRSEKRSRFNKENAGSRKSVQPAKEFSHATNGGRGEANRRGVVSTTKRPDNREKEGAQRRGSFNMQMRHLEFKIPPLPPPERLVVRVAVPGSGNWTVSEPGEDETLIRLPPAIRSLSKRIRSPRKEPVFSEVGNLSTSVFSLCSVQKTIHFNFDAQIIFKRVHLQTVPPISDPKLLRVLHHGCTACFSQFKLMINKEWLS